MIDWSPGIGDPTLMGWLTVVLYFIVSILSFRVVFLSSVLFTDVNAVKQKRFWLLVAFVLLFLGINKQLDFQSLLTTVGKYYAHRDGWYENRRFIQITGIISLLVVMCASMLLFLRQMGAILKTNCLAIVGLCFLLLFVAVRATSFHHMDTVINTVVFGVRMNWVLELVGILSIATSTISLSGKRNKN